MKTSRWKLREGIDPYERLQGVTGPGVSSIVDGGANKGRTVARLLELFPQACIKAYEPIPRLARKLAKRFSADPRVVVRPAALGFAPATLSLNVLESPTCSSLLTPTGIRAKHADKPMGVAQIVNVDVVRLDQELSVPPSIIKLDLQGYELEALKGAGTLLSGVKAVLCEVSFLDLYAGQPLGGEVIDWMEQSGFETEGLYSPWFNEAGQLVSADALFMKARF